MKILKMLVLAWLMIFGFSISTYGANPEKPISLQIENLTLWKNSLETSAVRQSLDAILKPRQNYPRFADFLEEVKKYNSIFNKPFLLLEAESTGFGGFFALVVFKSHPKVFRLWIYEIDKNIFELREIIPLQVTLNKIIMNDLADKRVNPFWVPSPSL